MLARVGTAISKTCGTNFAAVSEGAAATTTQGTERTSATAGKFSASKVLDEDNDTYWTLNDGATSGQITIDLGQRRVFDLVSIQEYIPLGQRIVQTKVEYSNDGTSWQTFAETTTVGYRRLVVDSPVAAQYVRVTVTNTSECDGVPILSSIGVYKTSADMERKGGIKIPGEAVYVDDRDSMFNYTGSWAEYNSNDGKGSTHKGSGTANNSVTFTFAGSQFYVMGIVDPGHGPVEVTVDGKELGTFNTYAGTRKTEQVLYASPGLSYGAHTVTLTVKTGDPKTYFDFDGVYYVGGENRILEFSKSAYPVREGDEAVVTVRRAGGSQGDISFRVIDLPGSAVSGQHYNVVNELITLHEGETEATVHARTIQGDAANLQFYLQIAEVTGGALLGDPTTAEIRILDATGKITLEPDGETFTEQDPFLMPSVVGQTNKLEAEHMVLDSTGAAANKYIRIQIDASASGGKKVGWFEPNDKAYLHYYAPKAGVYTMTLRYESGRSAGSLNTVNWRGDTVEDYAGEIPGTMSGGSLTYGEESFDFTVTRPGYGVIEFYADSHASPNIDWFTFRLDSVPSTPTVTVSASGYYEGERTSAAVTAIKADGPEAVDTLDCADCTEAGNDGKITGLNPASAYQYKLVSEDGNSWRDIPETPGATVLPGLAPGSYHVRVKETETHTAGPASRTLTILAYSTSGHTYRDGVITFNQGVTGDLVISGAGVRKTYSVTYEFTNLSATLGPAATAAPVTVGHGDELTFTISPRTGYTLPTAVAVSVDGNDLDLDTDFTYSAGTMTVVIEAGRITGDVVITADGVRQMAALTGVTISGTAMEGRRLTATVGPAGATVICQWIRVDGETETDISGAAYSRYMLTEDDVGKKIKVEVIGTGGYGGTLTSGPAAVIEADPTVAVTAVSLDQTAATVAVGGTVQLIATVMPDDATNKDVQWSSNDESVAEVSANGMVTALKAGTAVITVTTVSDGRTAECEVTVAPGQQQDDPPASYVPTTPVSTTEITKNDDGTTSAAETVCRVR